MIRQAREVLDKCLDDPKDFSLEVITESRNYVYSVSSVASRDYIVKIMDSQQENPFGNVEFHAYDWLKDTVVIPKCFYKGQLDGRFQYVILQYIAGRTLLDSLPSMNQDELYDVMGQAINFIKSCAKVKTNGFGQLDSNRNGRFKSYQEFVMNSLEEQQSLLTQIKEDEKKQLLEPFVFKLVQYFTHHPLPHVDDSHMVPLDANPANFILANNNQLVAIDLELFVGGDLMLALGAWMTNWYHMDAFVMFLNQWGPIFNMKLAFGFAVLRTLNILLHLAIHTDLNLATVQPFGSPFKFYELIQIFIQNLQ